MLIGLLNKKKYILHILLWVVFILLPTITFSKLISYFNPESTSKLNFIVVYSTCVMIGLFYLNYLVLIPKYYFSKNRKAYFIVLPIAVILTLLIFRIPLIYYIKYAETLTAFPKRILFLSILFRVLIALIISSGLAIYEKWIQAEKEKLIAEISLLRAQINPHFLFNSLNFIYVQVYKKDEVAANSIAKLSSIMQFITSDSSQNKISLDKELNFITSYIELQKLRLTNSTEVHFSIIGESNDGLNIEPMLLISIIENAFKYGVSTEKNTKIFIEIKMDKEKLSLFVKNDIINIGENIQRDIGVGLENTKNRLNVSYQNCHQLIINNEGNKFMVELIVFLI
jgi:LytS/YehU family sensor histidine kinase